MKSDRPALNTKLEVMHVSSVADFKKESQTWGPIQDGALNLYLYQASCEIIGKHRQRDPTLHNPISRVGHLSPQNLGPGTLKTSLGFVRLQ